VQNVVEPDEILHRQRAVEAHLRTQAGQALVRRVAAEDGKRRIARDQSHDQENDEGKPQQDRDQREEPPRNVAEHRRHTLKCRRAGPHSLPGSGAPLYARRI
jgi:hypothetical protein